MNELNLYKIIQVTHYDEIELHIIVGNYESKNEDIERFANQKFQTVLKKDGLHIIFGEEYFVIKDDEKEKYHFEICTKEMPPPIDARIMTKDEINSLLNDERYMTTHEDFKKVDWNLSKAYTTLKQNNPDKEHFSFSSLAYGIEKGV